MRWVRWEKARPAGGGCTCTGIDAAKMHHIIIPAAAVLSITCAVASSRQKKGDSRCSGCLLTVINLFDTPPFRHTPLPSGWDVQLQAPCVRPCCGRPEGKGIGGRPAAWHADVSGPCHRSRTRTRGKLSCVTLGVRGIQASLPKVRESKRFKQAADARAGRPHLKKRAPLLASRSRRRRRRRHYCCHCPATLLW
jgi:hypothetical protein